MPREGFYCALSPHFYELGLFVLVSMKCVSVRLYKMCVCVCVCICGLICLYCNCVCLIQYGLTTELCLYWKDDTMKERSTEEKERRTGRSR